MQQFPPIVRQHWLESALKAAGDKAIDADTVLQGRIIGPRAERPDIAPWRVFQRLDNPSPEKALAQARDDLANGADGLIISAADRAAVLDELPLHSFDMRNEDGDEGAKAIFASVHRQPIDPARLTIDLGIGGAALAKQAMSQGFSGPFMRADGRPAHGAGASEGQEIGTVLAQGLAHLRSLEMLDDAALCRSTSVTLAATPCVFETIAKFRAARILWGEMLRCAGLPSAPLKLHGETSQLCLAVEDAHTNILRIAATAFGAALGGADSFCALPHSFAQGVANGFARRVARNAQLLLQQESQIWRVADPAAGAGALERLTSLMCNEAWSVMQSAEKGVPARFDHGGQRFRPVIGVKAFRNPHQAVADVEAVS
jgi:methylmalonyl-CoA mutase